MVHNIFIAWESWVQSKTHNLRQKKGKHDQDEAQLFETRRDVKLTKNCFEAPRQKRLTTLLVSDNEKRKLQYRIHSAQ